MADMLDRLKTALSDRYTVERELGRGGMAVVYLAQDLKHERQVAVKVLRPELAATLGAERFLQEVRIAANLHHPHILPLYDSGDADGFLYYVMPYVKGESLRDKLATEGELPIVDAVRILKEVVDALAKAHAEGVVHRDIKPDNVMLSDRHALVTDFGVAKAVSEATGRQQLTTAGVALGTPAYMAPEQASADPHIDHRADIYAVGALAYELLTGRPPFTGTTQQEILAAHVTLAAEPVTKYRGTVSPALAQLVMKCLEKKPADRWQTAEEMIPHLEVLATPSGGMTPTATVPVGAVKQSGLLSQRFLKPTLAAVVVVALTVIGFLMLRPSDAPTVLESIAVLPFENATGDTVHDITAEGLTRELITALTSAGARVKGHRSVARYADSELPLGEIARELSADALAFGSLLQMGESATLSMELIDPENGENRWSSTFDARPDELPTMTNRIAQELAFATNSEVSPERLARLTAPLRVNPEAYAEYAFGTQQVLLFTMDGFRRSVERFNRAIELDASFAPAWAGLGYAYGIASEFGFLPPEAADDLAGAAIDSALARDPDLGLAYVSLGNLVMTRDWNWDAAERAFLRAIELSPTSHAFYEYGGGLVTYMGRTAEGLRATSKAVDIDPTSTRVRWGLVWTLFHAHDFERALAEVDVLLELDSDFPGAWRIIAMILAVQGHAGEAIAAQDRYEELGGRELDGRHGYLFALAGRTEEAMAELDRWTNREPHPNNGAALINVALGEFDTALSQLEQINAQRYFWSWFHPMWDPIRDDPRFQAMLVANGVAER